MKGCLVTLLGVISCLQALAMDCLLCRSVSGFTMLDHLQNLSHLSELDFVFLNKDVTLSSVRVCCISVLEPRQKVLMTKIDILQEGVFKTLLIPVLLKKNRNIQIC